MSTASKPVVVNGSKKGAVRSGVGVRELFIIDDAGAVHSRWTEEARGWRGGAWVRCGTEGSRELALKWRDYDGRTYGVLFFLISRMRNSGLVELETGTIAEELGLLPGDVTKAVDELIRDRVIFPLSISGKEEGTVYHVNATLFFRGSGGRWRAACGEDGGILFRSGRNSQ